MGVPRSVTHRARTESPTPGIPQATTLPDGRAFTDTYSALGEHLTLDERIGLFATVDSLNSLSDFI
jgi:hypothetical protein